MSPLEYARITWANFNLKVLGFRKRSIESWRQARFVAYWSYLAIPKKEGYEIEEIYDFYPIEGDPSKKELERMRKKQGQLSVVNADKNWDALQKHYEKEGFKFKDGKMIYPEKYLNNGRNTGA